MRATFFLLSLLAVLGASLAPLYTQQRTIDKKNERNIDVRSYFIILNHSAPILESKEKVEVWINQEIPGILNKDLEIGHIYGIGADFRGFSAWFPKVLVDTIRALPAVRYVEEDQVMELIGQVEENYVVEANDTLGAAFTTRKDWGQIRSNQKSRNLATVPANMYTATSYANASAPTETWDWATTVKNTQAFINTGSTAKIWIVDTGVLFNHQEFGGRVTTVVNYALNNPANGDCNGHGTHCAGSAAGAYRGVAVGAEIGSVRVLNCAGSGSNTDVVAGFNYVANNQSPSKTNILSASLGGGKSAATDDSINAAAAKGVVPVVAAGNDNNANCCNYSPAGAKEAITVGATQNTDARSTFSNSGSCLDVFAPGNSIHSAWYTSNTAYNTISGTSMATPLVSGSVALFATQKGVKVTHAQVKQAITDFATRNVVTGTLLSGTPNLFINAAWN